VQIDMRLQASRVYPREYPQFRSRRTAVGPDAICDGMAVGAAAVPGRARNEQSITAPIADADGGDDRPARSPFGIVVIVVHVWSLLQI
jgi:hypothetical protein